MVEPVRRVARRAEIYLGAAGDELPVPGCYSDTERRLCKKHRIYTKIWRPLQYLREGGADKRFTLTTSAAPRMEGRTFLLGRKMDGVC